MLVRGVVVLVAWVTVVQGSATQDAISVDTKGGYQGVVVALSENLNGNNCTQYVESITTMFTEASTLMYSATGRRLYFGEVIIAVPDTWICSGISADFLDYNWETSHLRVGPSHYLFSDNPWTQQPGGCGDPGDFIYLSENYVLGDFTTLETRGHVLVHEWAKFRWGVFEEYGHAHDPIYPSTYRSHINTFHPNYCTNGNLTGTYSEQCTQDGQEQDCVFTPDFSADTNTTEKTTTLTSSLMAAPFLDTVDEFCDDTTHNPVAPTKHNFLCDQLSSWHVINQHSDLKRAPGSGVTAVTVRTVRATAPRTTTVFLVDHSAVMGSLPSRWEFLRDALRQYILTEAPMDSRIGVVIFSNVVESFSPLYTLENVTISTIVRNTLASMIPRNRTTTGLAKNLKSAIQTGKDVLGTSGGTLVLVTECVEEYDASGQNLTGTAGSTPVWPILYPTSSSVSTQVYQDLADLSVATPLIKIPHQEDVQTIADGNTLNYQAVDNYALLTTSLRQTGGVPTVEVASSRTCQELQCTIPLSVQNSIAFEKRFLIEVLHSSVFMPSPYKVTVQGPSMVTESYQISSSVFLCSPLTDGNYTVTVTGNGILFRVVARVLGLEETEAGTGKVTLDVWAPRGLDQLTFSPGVAPRFFAMVETGNGRRVVGADVSAVVQLSNQSVTVKLGDGGVRGDVTGSDGVYSGFLTTAYEPGAVVDIMVKVTDNNGTAKAVGPPLPPRSPPTSGGGQGCCGSQLDLSGLTQEVLDPFSVTSSGVRGRLTGVAPGTLPPGRVTDLRSERSFWDVTLSFTAPGATLDQSIADHFEARYQTPGWNTSTVTNISAQDVGTVVTKTITLPNCDLLFTFTVVAVDRSSISGKASNPVREIVSCFEQLPNKLSSGEIAGIVIGCILGVLLILIIIYLCCHRDNLDDVWLWRMLTCRCCFEDEIDDDHLYNPPPRSSKQSDVIRNNVNSTTTSVTPIRNISDLYSRPNLEAKRTQRLKNEERQQQADDSDDGGFGNRRHKSNVNTRPAVPPRRIDNHTSGEEEESPRSSINSHSTNTTLPINQIGLPAYSQHRGHQPTVSKDNYGYDDGSGDNPGYKKTNPNYSNLPPRQPHPREAPPRPPRINTQV